MLNRYFIIIMLLAIGAAYISLAVEDELPIALPVSNVTGEYNYQTTFPDMDRPYKGPLPWEGDQKFIAAIRSAGNPHLLAAYKANLVDPLPGEGYNIALAARMLAGTTVKPGAIYSQNRTLGPYTTGRGYKQGPTYKGNKVIKTVGGGVCKIASLTYNIATFCDLEIMQRYSHGMTVPYVPAGQDATVCFGVKDFQFRNNTGQTILLWAEREGETLYVAVYGFTKPPYVTWHHKVLRQWGFPRVFKANPKLLEGQEKVIINGSAGLLVKSWVTIQYPNGDLIVKNKGVNYYSPCPEVVERKTKPLDGNRWGARYAGPDLE